MPLPMPRTATSRPRTTTIWSALIRLLLLFLAQPVFAGQFNPVMKIGQQAPAYQDLPGVDGRKHKLSDWKETEVLVIVFTCNSCPYAVEYEDRIIEFATRYIYPGRETPPTVAGAAAAAERPAQDDQVNGEETAQISGSGNRPGKPVPRVAVVAINVNKVPEDSFQEMTKRAAAKKLPYPYLYDETQQIARDYGAVFTPEFFVLDRERHVVYMGAMDDNSDRTKVTRNYLQEAVDAVLAGGKPEVTETVAVGCRVRFERDRRKK